MSRTSKLRTLVTLGRVRGSLVATVALATLTACGAVYPEIAPPVRPFPAGRELAPPPPDDLLYVEFISAKIPEKTRDGRKWDAMGGDAPDVYAQLFVDDVEVLKTSVASNALEPKWADRARSNYRIPLRSKVRVELWDSNPINNHPVCVEKVRSIHDYALSGELLITCDSGARVKLKVERAHARLGLGFFYELRSESVAVSRVVAESPAARAGLKKGDILVKIQDKEVRRLDQDEVKSVINANATTGLSLVVKDDAGERKVDVKAGPIYPATGDAIPLD